MQYTTCYWETKTCYIIAEENIVIAQEKQFDSSIKFEGRYAYLVSY